MLSPSDAVRRQQRTCTHPRNSGRQRKCNRLCFTPTNPSAWYMHRQVYIKISTFRPHTLFMCVVRFSQFITITSLRRIHWFLFLSETHCVLCDVRTDILCTMWINFNPKTVKCKVGRMVFAVNNATLHRTDQYWSVQVITTQGIIITNVAM